MMYSLAFVMVTVLSVCLPPSSASLPGLQLRLTKKGLDFANAYAKEALAKELRNLKIPDLSGTGKNIEWKVTRIETKEMTTPDSSTVFDASQNGLRWNVDGLDLDLHSHYWRVKYKKGWFKVSTSGSVDLKCRRASAQVTVSLGETNGRPSVRMSQCRASITKVRVYFYGGTAFLLNLFRGVIGNKIKDVLEKEICQVARKLIDLDLNKELQRLKVETNLGPEFILDYKLVSAPKVKATELDLGIKGEVSWHAEEEESPISPPPIPALQSNDHMLYVWVTEYLANTASFHAYMHGHLEYHVTEKDFPSSTESFLAMTCPLLCVGNFVPQLGLMYPNSKMEVSVRAARPPTLSISPKGVSLNGTALIDLSLIESDRVIGDAVNIELDIYMALTGYIRYGRLAGEIIEHRIYLKRIETAVGDMNTDHLSLMLTTALDMALVPSINAILKQGIDLPVTPVMSFENSELSLLDGSILIATDAAAPKDFPSETEIRQTLMDEKKKQQELLLQEKQQEQLTRLSQIEKSKTTQIPEEQQTPEQQPNVTDQEQTTSGQRISTQQVEGESQMRSTATPEVEKEIAEPHRTTEQPPNTEGSTSDPELKKIPSKQEHGAFCDKLSDFCHSSLLYCN